jgi:DNA ligase (NAD+)
MCITWSFIWTDWNKVARDDLAKQLESIWWDFVSSVSKNTDFLLAWDKAWSKLKKATELWVTVINLEEFLWEINK